MDWDSVVKQLHAGELSFEKALGLLAPAERGAAELSVVLARSANREQAGALIEKLLAAECLPGIQYGVGTELVRRGHGSVVLQHEWDGSLVVEFMIAATEARELTDSDAFFSQAVDHLKRALADPDTNPLSVLGAKHFMERLDPSFRLELLAWLAPEVEAENEDGVYDDLDYAHGQVDPMIELARCFVGAGMLDEALPHLESRKLKRPQTMHLAELKDLAAISNALPGELRQRWWQTWRGWAKAADVLDSTQTLEAAWLLLAEARWD